MDEKIPKALSTFYSPPTERSSEHAFLTGLRGFLTVGTFLYTFFLVFLPGSVAGLPTPVPRDETPFYALILRYTLSVLFWNGPLLYSFAILLSARTIVLPFLLASKEYQKTAIASSIARRPFRLAFAFAIPLAIAQIMWKTIGVDYIEDFMSRTNNTSAPVPYVLPNALTYLNSLLGLFAINKDYANQAASYTMPGGTAFNLSIVYQQSMTVYMTMVIIPFTHASFRVKALLVFIVTAWWVQSWAWYSITGMLMADAVINMDYRNKFDRGLPISVFPELLRVPLVKKLIRKEDKWGAVIRIPAWFLVGALMLAGMIMQYIWTAWRPQDRDLELTGHTAEYYSGGLNTDVDINAPQARDDNYFLILGFLLLVEGSARLRHIFTWSPFMYLGERSLSKWNARRSLQYSTNAEPGYFLTQGFFIYGAGIKLYLALIDRTSSITAVGVCFLVCALASALGAEIFYRIIDQPSRVVPHKMFAWLTS